LSRRLEALDPTISAAIRMTIHDLHSHIELVDLRLLIPAMGVLARDHAVDLLAAEAVAAAAYLETAIEVEIDAAGIRTACRREQVADRVTG
jgi:hypothetical protein